MPLVKLRLGIERTLPEVLESLNAVDVQGILLCLGEPACFLDRLSQLLLLLLSRLEFVSVKGKVSTCAMSGGVEHAEHTCLVD